MSKKRWFRFYIDQWFKGSFGLSPNEIAAYVTILCELYDNDGIVALDIEVMARRCGMRPSSFQKALDVLIERKKVFLEAGLLTQKAVAEEIKSREKLGDKSAKSRANLSEKNKEINAIRSKVTPYIKEQNTNSNSSTFNGSRALPITRALEEAAAKSPAVAGALARRYQAQRPQ
jgi:uncharacterized protein YdaU (DUF1376 family)